MSYERTDRAVQSRSRIIRGVVLGAMLVLTTGMAYAHQRVSGAAKPPGVDALCPFGGLETLYSLFAGGALIQRIALSSIVLLLGMVVLALIMRRSFCGQLCPLGALQGAFGWVGSKIWRKRPTMPSALDGAARYLKYAVLVVFLLWTWQAAQLVMRPFDPWVAWAHLTSAELLAEFGIGAAVLAVSLAGSLIYDRFFCKYLCPTGAFLGIFSKVSLFGIRRDADACIDCGICNKACPMNVEVATADVVTASECISCNECVNSCPAKGALEVKGGGSTLSALGTTGLIVAVLAGVVALGTVSGNFAWSMPTLAEAVENTGPSSTGTFDTSLIKGYMSMAEISAATGIPAEEFSAAFGVPEADLGKPMKEIKDTYGFSPHDVGAWVDEQLQQQ